jgi:hypothetical protein|tara:strand:- start:1118 stop:1354 length:237 start_codon:yes stop_codon:yes gene_type:complete
MILLSANSFIISGGGSIDAWALLLLIPIPLLFIISKRTRKEIADNNKIEGWEEKNEDFIEIEKEADDPVEAGFDIPIL